MPFQKGNKEQLKGKPKGKHTKTKQWEALGEAIVGEHSERFNEILSQYADEDPKKFLDAYLQVLNYFKPKYSSATIESDQAFHINVNMPGMGDNLES